jgi:hypothetical protein
MFIKKKRWGGKKYRNTKYRKIRTWMLDLIYEGSSGTQSPEARHSSNKQTSTNTKLD